MRRSPIQAHPRPAANRQAKALSRLDLTVIHARKESAPEWRSAIDWKLITDLPVTEAGDAIEKLVWYAARWKIEVFHKILKSGCRAEDARLRSAERLVNLIAVFCILAWRLFWMTMINRAAPDASPKLALTNGEIEILDRIANKRPPRSPTNRSLAHYMTQIAKLGGYLARAHDPPPGNTAIWRGWSRLVDIQIGANPPPATYGVIGSVLTPSCAR